MMRHQANCKQLQKKSLSACWRRAMARAAARGGSKLVKRSDDDADDDGSTRRPTRLC